MTSRNTLRKLLSPILYATGAYERRWHGDARREAFTLVVAYHRVVPDETPRPGRFDIERGVPVSVFEQHIRFLRKHFKPVRPSQVTEASPDPMRFAVTLDDGYEDNYTVAAPVLRRLGVTAGFYVVSDYVGTDRLFWWEILAQMVRESTEPFVDLASTVPDMMATHSLPPTMSLSSPIDRDATYERLSAALRAEPHTTIPSRLDSLAEALDVRSREEGRDYGLMSWSQLRKLDHQGFEIGGHTATHCNLSGVGPGTLETEVRAAIECIQRQLEVPVLTFAYPYGRDHHFDDSAERAVEAAGCRAGFTTVTGAVRSWNRPFALPRLKFTRPLHFACAYNVEKALAKA